MGILKKIIRTLHHILLMIPIIYFVLIFILFLKTQFKQDLFEEYILKDGFLLEPTISFFALSFIAIPVSFLLLLLRVFLGDKISKYFVFINIMILIVFIFTYFTCNFYDH